MKASSKTAARLADNDIRKTINYKDIFDEVLERYDLQNSPIRVTSDSDLKIFKKKLTKDKSNTEKEVKFECQTSTHVNWGRSPNVSTFMSALGTMLLPNDGAEMNTSTCTLQVIIFSFAHALSPQITSFELTHL